VGGVALTGQEALFWQQDREQQWERLLLPVLALVQAGGGSSRKRQGLQQLLCCRAEGGRDETLQSRGAVPRGSPLRAERRAAAQGATDESLLPSGAA
jgi:hypothetical protein